MSHWFFSDEGEFMHDRFGELDLAFHECSDEYMNRNAYVDEPWHCYMCDRLFDNNDEGSDDFCEHIFACRKEQYEALRTEMINALLEVQKEFQR